MVLAVALNGAAEVVVQVKDSAGGPRIHVNGEPVPPRFFSGLISGSVRTGPEWRDVSFDFVPPSDETGAGDGSIRFRFNHLCEFHLSGIRVIDTQTGQDVLPRHSFDDEKTFAEVWAAHQAKETSKPEPKASAVWTKDGVLVSLAGQVSGWWPSFHLISHAPRMPVVSGHTCRCTFRVRSSARALVNVSVLWHKDKVWREIGEARSDIFASQLRMARQAGIRLCHVQMPNCLARPGRPRNWDPIDRLFRQILQVVPDALIVPRIPAYAPGWWKARHPETVMVFEGGRKGRMVTVSSRAHRRHMAAHFEKICRHLAGVASPQQSIDILRRSRGHAILRGLASWWTDIRDMGWHDDPKLWEIQHQLNPVEAAKLARTTRFAPQIAAIVDEDSMLHLSGRSRELARPLVYDSRAAFGRCGAPYGQYILDDVAAGRVSAPLQVFLAAWALTDRQREQLRANRRAGTTRAWCHAPGYVRPTGFDLKGITSLTGFEVKPIQLQSAEATPTADGKQLGITKPWGPKTPVAPLFAVVPSGGDRILATFSDRSPALVVRTSRTGTDVYLAAPALTTELLRALARIAGVHLYTQVDAAVWADGNLTSIHVPTDGPLEVTMPRAGAVTDIYSGRTFGSGPTVTIPARKGETLMLRCGIVE